MQQEKEMVKKEEIHKCKWDVLKDLLDHIVPIH